jgi:hypothetical protein
VGMVTGEKDVDESWAFERARVATHMAGLSGIASTSWPATSPWDSKP